MVWGGICLGARTELVAIISDALTADMYIRDVLQYRMIPFASHIIRFVFTCSCHKAPHSPCFASISNFEFDFLAI